MISNAPIERLINALIALDRASAGPDGASEVRCLMRKVEWVAAEAETALQRTTTFAPTALTVPPAFEHAA